MPQARGSQTVVAMVTSLPALSRESGDGLFDIIEKTDEHGHTLIGIAALANEARQNLSTVLSSRDFGIGRAPVAFLGEGRRGSF